MNRAGALRIGRRSTVFIVGIVAGVMLASQASFASPASKLWIERYDGPAGGGDSAYALGVSPDGSTVFAAGNSTGSRGDLDYAAVAYDASAGTKLWARRYDGPASPAKSTDGVNALAVDPDGSSVYITGNSTGTDTGFDYATVALDARTGSKLWIKRYDSGAHLFDGANDVEVSPDGSGVYVTGSSIGTKGADYATVAYDALTGSKLWVSRHDGPANDSDSSFALAVSPDSSVVYVTGGSVGLTSGQSYATVAYDASDGSELWVKRYDGPLDGSDLATAMDMSPDGTALYVTGASAGLDSGTDYATVAYDASNGSKLWAKRYNGPGNSTDRPDVLGVSPDGSAVYVTGFSTGSSDELDYATVAYRASTGSTLWTQRYDGPAGGGDVANALGIAHDGSAIYVTGQSAGSSGYVDYATVAYDASTGSELWAKRYDGPTNGNDVAHALGVSPINAIVYVTGGADIGSGSADFATIAYSTA